MLGCSIYWLLCLLGLHSAFYLLCIIHDNYRYLKCRAGLLIFWLFDMLVSIDPVWICWLLRGSSLDFLSWLDYRIDTEVEYIAFWSPPVHVHSQTPDGSLINPMMFFSSEVVRNRLLSLSLYLVRYGLYASFIEHCMWHELEVCGLTMAWIGFCCRTICSITRDINFELYWGLPSLQSHCYSVQFSYFYCYLLFIALPPLLFSYHAIVPLLPLFVDK